MAEDIGPGTLLICVKSCHCANCGTGVDKGVMYTCEELIEPSFLYLIIYGHCTCGQDHPFIVVAGKSHAYCPTVFRPLNDPDAKIEETEEPKRTAPITIKEFADRYLEREDV